jgi:glycosyltransferase involved in cell wall biosynthesis
LGYYKLTIITVTFNNLEGLRRTINNVSSFDHSIVQHIIIDGGSTDRTEAFLRKYEAHPISYISEKDKGIYDAMNKGIDKAEGEWIIFMNAGDTFHNSFDLEVLQVRTDVIYGNADVHYSGGFKRVLLPKDLTELWKGMSFSHQSTIFKNDLFRKNKFDVNYQYCADFKLIFQLYLKGYTFHQHTGTIATIEAGGVSDKKRYKATAEVFKINRKLKPSFKSYPYFSWKITYGYLSTFVKIILPKNIVNKIIEKRYK